jgi:hypothetical protein
LIGRILLYGVKNLKGKRIYLNRFRREFLVDLTLGYPRNELRELGLAEVLKGLRQALY